MRGLSYCRISVRGEVYTFDGFRLDVPERRLWRGEEMVPLRDKVFETLVLLVRGAGRLQRQRDLIDELWPDVSVEPNNLQHNISVLRKAFAGSSVRIETVRSRGYRLAADVKREPAVDSVPDRLARPSASTPQIRFCKAPDDTNLAWATAGSGPPIVKAGNWCSHLELDPSSLVFHHLLGSLSGSRCLIRYDARANGLSDHDVAEISFERWVEDLEAVVDAAGVSRFPLFGMSQGAAVSAAYAARHPDRVSALILVCGFVRGWRVKNRPKVTRHFEALLSLMETGWGRDNPAFRQIFSSAFFPDASSERIDSFNELQYHSATPRNAARMLSAIGDIDLRNVAPRVSAPTLVIHGRADMVFPFSDGKELAASIPASRFVPLDTKNHIPLVDDPAWAHMEREIHRFLELHAPT